MIDKESLAQKIIELLDTQGPAGDLAALRAGLDSINARLDKLEAVVNKADVAPAKAAHPSQERFAIAEAIADSVFNKKSNEKACTFEPNGKPCDHCSMCSSRGF